MGAIIPVIPTPTNRKRIIDRHLNTLVTERPEYVQGVQTLICYPILKWAIRTSETASPLPFLVDQDCLEQYHKIVSYIDGSVNCLRGNAWDEKRLCNGFCFVHDIGESPPEASLYHLREFYPVAAQKYFEANNDALRALGDALNEVAANRHDTGSLDIEYLLDSYRSTGAFNADPERFASVIDLLQKYPKDGPEASKSLALWLSGKTIDEIRIEAGMAWNTLLRYRRTGCHALEALRGCGIKDMIEMLRCEET